MYGYRVCCEWDIGQEYDLFADEDLAYKWAKDNLKECGIEEDIDDLIDEGLVGFESVKVNTKLDNKENNMNVFKYVVLRFKELFASKPSKEDLQEYAERVKDFKEVKVATYNPIQQIYEEGNRIHAEMYKELIEEISDPSYVQMKERINNRNCPSQRESKLPAPKHCPESPAVSPARKERKEYTRITNKQKARIKTLVARGKGVTAIAKDVGLPDANVRYYVKKMGE